jgi:hypothetical protein
MGKAARLMQGPHVSIPRLITRANKGSYQGLYGSIDRPLIFGKWKWTPYKTPLLPLYSWLSLACSEKSNSYDAITKTLFALCSLKENRRQCHVK